MGPRSIPKRHGKRQNFKAVNLELDAWRSVWLCPKNAFLFSNGPNVYIIGIK